jgi:hypothetical protein
LGSGVTNFFEGNLFRIEVLVVRQRIVDCGVVVVWWAMIFLQTCVASCG